MSVRAGVLGLALVASGCLVDNRASRDRSGASFFENVPVYKAPLAHRCSSLAKGTAPASSCEDAKYLGEVYVRRLSTGDEVCLEGGFGDEPGAGCLCRAAVADTQTNQVLLEVRSARPDSKWFNKEFNHFWFEEGALVDLYLAEHGY